MSFDYDLKGEGPEVVYLPEENVILDEVLYKKMNGSDFFLNVRVRNGNPLCLGYDIAGKTNLRAWRSEVSPEEWNAMDAHIREALECCARIGIPESAIVLSDQYMYVDDERGIINFIGIPTQARRTENVIETGRDNVEPERGNHMDKFFSMPGNL